MMRLMKLFAALLFLVNFTMAFPEETKNKHTIHFNFEWIEDKTGFPVDHNVNLYYDNVKLNSEIYDKIDYPESFSEKLKVFLPQNSKPAFFTIETASTKDYINVHSRLYDERNVLLYEIRADTQLQHHSSQVHLSVTKKELPFLDEFIPVNWKTTQIKDFLFNPVLNVNISKSVYDLNGEVLDPKLELRLAIAIIHALYFSHSDYPAYDDGCYFCPPFTW